MSDSTLYRTAAVGLVAGAVLVAVSGLAAPQGNDLRVQVAGALFYPTAIGGLLGGLLIIAAWPAAYLRQRRESGWLGLAAMLLVLMAGAVLTVGVQLIGVLLLPWVSSLPLTHSQAVNGPSAFGVFFPVASIAVGLGGVLFGVATIRSGVYSRPLGVGFIVLAVLSFVLGFLSLPGILGNLGQVAYMVALAWTGYELWLATRTERPVATAVGAPAAQAPSGS